MANDVCEPESKTKRASTDVSLDDPTRHLRDGRNPTAAPAIRLLSERTVDVEVDGSARSQFCVAGFMSSTCRRV